MSARGDVVRVDFPFSSGAAGKIRPARVVQNNIDNGRLRDTIVALISGNIKRVAESTQLLVDPATSEGASSGLHGPSAVICNQLYTIRQRLVLKKIGDLTTDLMDQVDNCLKAALDLA
jgi:mRNA interferase MazF